MKRLLLVQGAVILAAGCGTTQPTVNPFLGPQTVPPPGTGAAAPPNVSVPYYQGAPPPGQPPVTPGAPSYAPPAGSSYRAPQSSITPQALQNASTGLATSAVQSDQLRAVGQVVDLDAQLASSAASPVGLEASKTRLASASVVVRPMESAISIPDDNQPLRSRVQTPQPTQAESQIVLAQASETLDLAAARPLPNRPGHGYLSKRQRSIGTTVAVVPTAAQVPTLAVSPVRHQLRRAIPEITDLPPHRGVAKIVTTETVASPEVTTVAFQAASPLVRHGYDEGYQRLRGRLERSQATGQWKLRYIPIDGTTDDYGGSVSISNPDVLTQFDPGDFVTIEGRVIDDAQSSGSFAPSYRVDQIAAAHP